MKRVIFGTLALVLLFGTGEPVAAMGAVEAGVKGGVNFANSSTDPEDAELADSRMGLALGGYVGIPVLPSVKIQPEALFMMKGDEESQDGVTGSYKLNYIEVPVLAKIGFMAGSPAQPALFFGPSVGINTSANAEASGGGLDYSADVKDQTKAMDFGLVVGAGVDFQKLGVDVRYTHGLTNTVDSDDPDAGEAKNKVISVMGTFRFL